MIRTSDDSEQARTRLRDVFDLSEVQAEYILELRLRRLTKFSRIELEAERDALMTEIAQLQGAARQRACCIRAQVARELEAAADAHGTPRRTLLMNAKPAGAAPDARRAGSGPADRRCARPWSCSPRPVARCASTSSDGQALTTPGRRSKHDAILTTARSHHPRRARAP